MIYAIGMVEFTSIAQGIESADAMVKTADVQLLVATVALTLFLPCIAQFFMNIKERGWKIGFIISGFTLIMSFCVAYIVKVVANYALFIMRI